MNSLTFDIVFPACAADPLYLFATIISHRIIWREKPKKFA